VTGGREAPELSEGEKGFFVLYECRTKKTTTNLLRRKKGIAGKKVGGE